MVLDLGSDRNILAKEKRSVTNYIEASITDIGTQEARNAARTK